MWRLLLAFLVVSFSAGTAFAQVPAPGPGHAQYGPPPPVLRGAGTVAGGVAAISPGLPASTTAGDLLVMLLETQGDEAITVSGWTECPGSPVTDASTVLTRLTCFYKIAAGGDATTTSDSGNHQSGRIIGITVGTFNASPFDVSQSSNTTVDTTFSITGITTTVANTLVLSMCVADGPDANGTFQFSLDASFDTYPDLSFAVNDTRANSTGNGAALLLVTDIQVAAGAYPTLFGTSAASTTKANLMLAVQP